MTARSCSGCALCCRVLPIRGAPSEISDKPVGAWCKYCDGRSCSSYDHRPQVCKSFRCQWLIDSSLPVFWRPDKAGFVLMVEPYRNGTVLIRYVDSDRPDAWRHPRFHRHLQQFSRFMPVLIHVSATERLRLLPNREIPFTDQMPE